MNKETSSVQTALYCCLLRRPAYSAELSEILPKGRSLPSSQLDCASRTQGNQEERLAFCWAGWRAHLLEFSRNTSRAAVHSLDVASKYVLDKARLAGAWGACQGSPPVPVCSSKGRIQCLGYLKLHVQIE